LKLCIPQTPLVEIRFGTGGLLECDFPPRGPQGREDSPGSRP